MTTWIMVEGIVVGGLLTLTNKQIRNQRVADLGRKQEEVCPSAKRVRWQEITFTSTFLLQLSNTGDAGLPRT